MTFHPKPRLGMKLNKKHKLAKGLVGCWVFNEKTGDKVFDLSGHGNDGTIVGADWVAEGLDFVAANLDYISCGEVIPANSDFTITSTIDTSNIDLDDITIGYSGSSGTDTLMVYVSTTYGTANNQIRLYALNQEICVGSDIRNTGTRRITVVRNGDNFYVYLDAVLDASGSASGSLDSTMRIGDVPYVGRHFNDVISNTFIYNRALPPSEVAQLNRDSYAMFQPTFNPALLYGLPADSNWFLLPAQNKLQGMRGMNG